MNRRHFVLAGGAALASTFACSGVKTFALTAPPSNSMLPSQVSERLLFGVDYYPDQTPEHLWQQDAEAMAAYGVTSVRIAEFAWALMEPQEGIYDFGWLHRAVRLLHAHGIDVILGTPSAAPPPWLTQKYPEVLMVNDQGMTLSPGSRRFTCPTNATYRRLCVNIATQMARAFSNTPGIAGWQIDNELTLGSSPRCYCKYCRAGFQQWLRQKYGTLANLNQKWGTVFWSNTYTDFAQIPVPLPSGAPPNPGLALDYNRYQSYANADFLKSQLAVLRRLCPQHFVTTNNVGGLVDNIDLRELYRDLDFVSDDNYPGFFAIMAHGKGAGAMSPAAMAAATSFSLDFMRGVKNGEPFFIMEEQTGKSGQSVFSPQPEPGQLRLWSYQTIAHGAMGVQYFRWDTATFGAEEYWHGILQHDRQPSPGYDEIRRTIAELKALGKDALHARYEADIALCYSSSADWALAIQPGQPDLKYLAEMLAWYGGLSGLQTGVDMVDATQDLSRYKVLCAPAMYVVSEAQAMQIRRFVQQGGVFIAGFRLGVKDEYSRIVTTPLPGLLRDVMGVEVVDYEPIYSQKQAINFRGMLGSAHAGCRLWADILKTSRAEILATYTEGPYVGKAAITSHPYGKGRAVYLGCGLDGAELARVLRTLLDASSIRPSMQAAPGVEITRRSNGQRTWTFLLNHTGEKQTIHLDKSYKSHPDGDLVQNSVDLPPYGVRVLTSA